MEKSPDSNNTPANAVDDDIDAGFVMLGRVLVYVLVAVVGFSVWSLL